MKGTKEVSDLKASTPVTLENLKLQSLLEVLYEPRDTCPLICLIRANYDGEVSEPLVGRQGSRVSM